MSAFLSQLNKRRTLAIISHPDAGKTTITEKILLLGNLIQSAGTIKGKKSDRYAKSDWMELEKKRGISITTSVIRLSYNNCLINLLDTPGHEDFSEDTYRTLTAVDSVLMIIDSSKGVEPRTIKLMEVCRLRSIPILTFINKIDRDMRDPIILIDEIENTFNIECTAMNWPIASGKEFRGIYDRSEKEVILFETGHGQHAFNYPSISGLNNYKLDEEIGFLAHELREQVNLIEGASYGFDIKKYYDGKLTPVFFGTALNNFGVKEMLNFFSKYAPLPSLRKSDIRQVYPDEPKLTGFVFKIQANMDKNHRDRVAFLRICSGKYIKGIKLYHVRLNKWVTISNALTFIAGERKSLKEAYPGDIIGLQNHGKIKVGDTFTQGETLKFLGIPSFAPEFFQRVCLNDPMKIKSLVKGLHQLSEEGSVQIFKPLSNNDLILGVIGKLQFDVVAYRLKNEYGVECSYQRADVIISRWIRSENKEKFIQFKEKYIENLAIDTNGCLTYLSKTYIHLKMVEERNPYIQFLSMKLS